MSIKNANNTILDPRSSKLSVTIAQVREKVARTARINRKVHPSQKEPAANYAQVCQQRCKESKRKYNGDLVEEFKKLELYQSSAYQALAFHRHFIITTLWPPLHTRNEIELVIRTMDRAKYKDPADSFRLDGLLRHKYY